MSRIEPAAQSAIYRARGEQALVLAAEGLPQVRRRHAAAASVWFSLAAFEAERGAGRARARDLASGAISPSHPQPTGATCTP